MSGGDRSWPDGRRYLFICGCPRSGTTALWRLLVAHPQICLGNERYSTLSWRRDFGPRLFEQERFWDLRPGDTWYNDLDWPAYREMRPHCDGARYVGDKLPMLTGRFKELIGAFGSDLRVITIERDLDSVKASYQARFDDPNDKTWARWDATTAVEHWTRARAAVQAVAGDARFLTVSYEQLLVRGQGLAGIFNFLDLSVADSVVAKLDALLAEPRSVAQREALSRKAATT
jgi:hypothetical protein